MAGFLVEGEILSYMLVGKSCRCWS